MDKTQLIKRLMTTFLEELEEHVRSFNRDLLTLEKNPGPQERGQCLKTLFRTAHSLKGAAGAVNITLVEGACHRLEDILAQARDARLTLTPELFRLLFATVDGIEEAGMRLREQHDLTGAPLATLLPRLETAVAAHPRPPSPPEAAQPVVMPAPTPATIESHPPAHSETAPVPAPVMPVPAAAVPDNAAAASSLRVAANKLDNLLARTGELLVTRRRIQSRLAELTVLLEFVEHWEAEWRRVERDVDKLAGSENGAAAMSPRTSLVLRQNGTRLRRLKKDLEHFASVTKSDGRLLEHVSAPLDDEVRSVRMLPFAEACAGLDRMVRDLAEAAGKNVELRIEGGSVELDRSVLEGLKDPLRHLVRNAVDHGLEPPAQRRQLAEPERGRLVVAAALLGSQVEVRVEDDGRGLDAEALREQARRRHLPEPDNDRDLAQLIFLPGFSTASIITDISGRGVGLDVVKSRVEALHGTVELAFVPGGGTTFKLTVPLTLTTLRAVLVGAAGQVYAFAGANVHRFVRADSSELRTVAGRSILAVGGQPLPFAYLADVLQTNGSAPREDGGKISAIVVTTGDKRMAFAVDEFLAEQEILIKNLGPRVRQAPFTAGATLLASGRIALVLNAASLVRSALGRTFAARSAEPLPTAPVRKKLLVVEDSVTTRTLEKSILEAAGYDVATAVDGQAAWEFLQSHDIDLIVSDVEMPNMDGFDLAEAVRAAPKLARLPLVLVTARESEQDKARGISVGASAYLAKSAFDQRNLLETIAQLV